MTHDAAGRVNSSVDPRGNEAGADPDAYRTRYGHDAAGNTTSVTRPGNTASTTEYDRNGNRTVTTDANGNATSFGYDKLNRLDTVTGADGAVTDYGYDSVGNLTTRTARNVVNGYARAQTTTYGYNADRRMTSVTTPMGDTFRYTYDKAGNLTRVEDANGSATSTAGDGVTTYTYTRQDRLKAIDYADTGAGADVSYTYFPTGDRKSMTDTAGTETYTYDNRKLASVRRDNGQTFTYTYDKRDNIASRTYPDGTKTSYTYNLNGSMRTVTSNGAQTVYSYFPGGRLKTTDLPNGYRETRDYKPNGRLALIKNTDGASGAVLSSASYSYDQVGNPTRVVTEDETVDYTYNKRNMLTLACYGGSPCDTSGTTSDAYYKYSYDRVGNRLSKQHAINGTNETFTYTYNTDDELTLKQGPTGDCAFTHDRNGNMTDQCGLRFTYNDANQMTSAAKSGTTQTYTYDGDGKRLTAGNGTSITTRYQWDINNKLPQLARESGGSGGILRRYTQGRDTISMTTGTGTYYYHYDGLGSVTDVTDSAGAQQLEYRYEAFGDLRQDRSVTGAPDNKLKYTGEYHDEFTDTYHLRARQYDSHLGRFTQTDPRPAAIRDPYVASYAYTNNHPTKSTDPSGRIDALALAALGDLALAALGVGIGALSPTFAASVAVNVLIELADVLIEYQLGLVAEEDLAKEIAFAFAYGIIGGIFYGALAEEEITIWVEVAADAIIEIITGYL